MGSVSSPLTLNRPAAIIPGSRTQRRMQDEGIKKLYYTISEVCTLTGEEAHVLRYWETVFPPLDPRKSRAGKRVYTDGDIVLIRRIQHLLREDKYTIEGARQALSREHRTERQARLRRRELKEVRDFLADLLAQLPEKPART